MTLNIPTWIGYALAYAAGLALFAVCAMWSIRGLAGLWKMQGIYWIFIFMLTHRNKKAKEHWTALQMDLLRRGLYETNPSLEREIRNIWLSDKPGEPLL